MARILYGVSGQGFGHAARSQEVIAHLLSQRHEVFVFTYSQGVSMLQGAYPLYEIPGLGLSYRNNKLLYWKTLTSNIKQLMKNPRKWPKILATFRDFDPDIVITDFEPLSALLAKIEGKPLISIDNQHQLTNTRISVPTRYQKDFIGDKLVIKSLIRRAHAYLVTSFFETPIIKKNTQIFPPIIRKEVLSLRPTSGEYILVYAGAHFDNVLRVLRRTQMRYIVFSATKHTDEPNITFKKHGDPEWLPLLAGCQAVIGTAGLSLISESLYLGKPYFALPIRRQIEQIVNALYLERLGYGAYSERVSAAAINDFIANISQYQAHLATYPRQYDNPLFAALDGGINELLRDLR
jgi:uncharacterized protein (TIGR00661 family)